MPKSGASLLPIALAALVVSAPLLSGRLVAPPVAVGMLGSAGALGLCAGLGLLVTGLVRRRKSHSGWPLMASAAACLAIGVAVAALLLVPPAPSAHRFNDVTTSLAEPPSLVVGPAAGTAYPEQFVPWHREAYADLATYRMGTDPASAFTAVRGAAARMPGWEILHEDAGAGTLQALARTPLFRFEDDVVIRVRAAPGGSDIDVRSRSRFGGGDRGANAARIRAFLASLEP